MTNHLEVISKASASFAKAMGATPLKSSGGVTAEIIVTHTDEFKIRSRHQITQWLEAKGFKTILIGTEYEIMSKDATVKGRKFNVQVCLWSNRMSVRYSVAVPVKKIESLDQWLR